MGGCILRPLAKQTKPGPILDSCALLGGRPTHPNFQVERPKAQMVKLAKLF